MDAYSSPHNPHKILNNPRSDFYLDSGRTKDHNGSFIPSCPGVISRVTIARHAAGSKATNRSSLGFKVWGPESRQESLQLHGY